MYKKKLSTGIRKIDVVIGYCSYETHSENKDYCATTVVGNLKIFSY